MVDRSGHELLRLLPKGQHGPRARALLDVLHRDPARPHAIARRWSASSFRRPIHSHADPLPTANFVTQDDIGGADTEYINDVELRNAPDTTVSRRGAGAAVLLVVGLVFRRVDNQPSIRQLYPIAELGKPAGEPTRAPEFMRLLVAPEQPRISGADLDFRDEIMAQIFDRGDPIPKRTLKFHIEVTDEGETTGPVVRERRTFKNWRRIGSLIFDNAVISSNGDSVIHFSHPSWRTDRNDPATATRIDGRKVR